MAKYLNKEELNKIGLSSAYNIGVLIKETGSIDEYLEPLKIKELRIEGILTNLIKETKNPEKYLLKGQSIDDKGLVLNITNAIKGTGDIDKYLNPEIAKLLGLNDEKITKLIRETKNPEKYLLEGQNIQDENIKFNIINLIKAEGNPEKYLTEEKLKELGLLSNKSAILEIIELARKSRRIP